MFRVPALLACLIAACSGPTEEDAGTLPDAGHDAGHDAGPMCDPASGLPDPLVCNGSDALCERAYDAVAYPTAHNAMSSAEEDWIPPNQGRRLWHQLEDGVRGFMLDTYEEDGETLLCHAICPLGSRPLVDALVELRTFMDCFPGEVITLLLEAHIGEAPTAEAFATAGLMPYLHEQAAGAPWPTLREMIVSGRRMVVFTQDSSVTQPWHHPVFEYAWDTPFANMTPDDFGCELGRGSTDHSIFILNHFLTAPVAMRSLAEMVNFDPFFTERAQRCQTEAGQLPNFVTVDFYDVGDIFDVVNVLNRL